MNHKSTLLTKTSFLLVCVTLSHWTPVCSQNHFTQNVVDEIVNGVIRSESLEKNQVFISLPNRTNYTQLVGNSQNQFFNTLDEKATITNKTAKWKKFTDEIGAFSVNLPGEPVDMSRDAPNPMDEDGEPYHLNMFTASDENKENLYLVRYNDMPNGYYLNDREAGFSSIEDNLEGKAVLVGEPKEIRLGDIEGREIEIQVQGKYHAFMRIYIRGNRIYVLMAQKMNTTEKISIDNEFFKSFKFEKYDYIQPTKYQPSPNDFEVSFFGDVKVVNDTLGYESTTIQQTTNHYSINPRSGGLYQLNHGELQEYVQIKDLKTYYDEHIQLYLEYNDTIIDRKDVTINGSQGMTFMIQNKFSKMPERHQIWLDNNRLFVMTAYLSKEELENPISDKIFNSFKYDSSKEQTFDRLSSKTEKLLKDLHAPDTLRVQRALGAIDYYKFEVSDLPKLYQALKETYKDSLYTMAIKEVIISTFPTLHDENTIETLKTLYKDSFKDDQELKSAIVSIIPAIEEANNLEVYKELMQHAPPTSSENYNWQILSPFRDSITFAMDNFKLLTSLMEHDMYRNPVLNIASEIVRDYSDKKSLVLDEQTKLLKFARQDLDLYIKSLNDTLVDPYKYSGLMNAYLSFFNETATNSDVTDDFTKTIMGLEDNNWYKNQALTARIRSKQSLEKPMVSRLMDSLYYRYEIMKAFYDTGQFQEVPNKYKQADSFAELSLHFNLVEDDYEPESIQIMGNIDKNGLSYFAYKVKYDEGDEALTSYIMTVGPIKDVSKMDELKLYNVYTDWDQMDYANWKSQAEQLIPDELESDD
jgi:hypothetical protein